MTVVCVSPRFRITIPKEIRKTTDLKVGDNISFLKKGDEIVMFKVPSNPLQKMRGSIKTNKNVRKILEDLRNEEINAEQGK